MRFTISPKRSEPSFTAMLCMHTAHCESQYTWKLPFVDRSLCQQSHPTIKRGESHPHSQTAPSGGSRRDQRAKPSLRLPLAQLMTLIVRSRSHLRHGDVWLVVFSYSRVSNNDERPTLRFRRYRGCRPRTPAWLEWNDGLEVMLVGCIEWLYG